MSYKSHSKSANRAFDHIYDPVHKSSSQAIKLNYKALAKTAPLHVIPCHSTMFTDLVTRPRNFYFSQQNQLPFNPSDIRGCQRMLCDRAINTNLFFLTPIELCHNSIEPEIYQSTPKTRSIECQTKYRESTAQTEPWLPDVKLRDGEKELPEVLLVNCLNEPVLRDVEAIERQRIRRDWEKALPDVATKDFPLRTAQLEVFELENFFAREKEMNEMQKDRMEQVSQMIDDRQQTHRFFAEAILENVQMRNEIEMEQKKKKLNISVQRKLRQVEQKLHHQRACDCVDYSPTFKKEVLNPKVDLHVFFKASTVTAVSEKLSKLSNKRKILWKPKDRVKEAAHGFLKESNLKLLCESLKKDDKKTDSFKCRSRLERFTGDLESFRN